MLCLMPFWRNKNARNQGTDRNLIAEKGENYVIRRSGNSSDHYSNSAFVRRKRIPELARAFGRASYEFKKAKDAIKKETEAIEAEVKEKPSEFKPDSDPKNPQI